MTLLLWSFVVEGKTAGAVKQAGHRRMTRLGIVERALNEARNLTSTPRRLKKTQLKIRTKNREQNNDKIRRNLLTGGTKEMYANIGMEEQNTGESTAQVGIRPRLHSNDCRYRS
jgi:hypothetical protein